MEESMEKKYKFWLLIREIYLKIKKQISIGLNTEKIFGDGKGGINIAKYWKK